jgi:hypothetical protein
MKRVNITTIVLSIYVFVMAIMGWPGRNPGQGYTQYFVVLAASIVVILVLRYVQIKRMKARDEFINKSKE